MGRVNRGNIGEIIVAACEEAAEENMKAVRKNAAKAAEQAAEELRQTSARRTGKYADGWTTSTKETGLGVAVTVHNETKPSLTHLLENGHAKKNGGRTKGDKKIAKAYENAKKAFEGGGS